MTLPLQAPHGCCYHSTRWHAMDLTSYDHWQPRAVRSATSGCRDVGQHRDEQCAGTDVDIGPVPWERASSLSCIFKCRHPLLHFMNTMKSAPSKGGSSRQPVRRRWLRARLRCGSAWHRWRRWRGLLPSALLRSRRVWQVLKVH
jgi:hypothetical protein